jgi:hypothetical protein
MNPQNAPILGYVLLLVGVSLAIIGYVIYLNIRGEKGEGAESSGDESRAAENRTIENSDDDVEVEQQEEVSESYEESDSDGKDDESEGTDMRSSESIEKAVGEDTESLGSDVEDEEGVGPAMVLPDAPELIPAATLFREGVSGEIVVQVGENQYTEVNELKNSKDWERIRSLSSDLINWIEDKPSSERSKEDREISVIEQASEAQPLDSNNMIVQINEIINKKVQMMEGEEREIKLVEGLIGELEVRVGVEKFPIDDVPYENVRDLIQDAVSQWEKSQ